ncbi:hypothetical protein KM1_012200 [Entamoeba histolytica HM-3:IMSS]|uniref:Uncharacterized protein n=1 Tax=Entamoeba histolytica HM-3:IMSS TaxID=885315 RepID=M7WG91_ENTHI|nr:hypothetical protein KM1_012200 [Entamoeba histolytica HM-3:IMSS]
MPENRVHEQIAFDKNAIKNGISLISSTQTGHSNLFCFGHPQELSELSLKQQEFWNMNEVNKE